MPQARADRFLVGSSCEKKFDNVDSLNGIIKSCWNSKGIEVLRTVFSEAELSENVHVESTIGFGDIE